MLWFIKDPDTNENKNESFQNIICYGLSSRTMGYLKKKYISKHHMLWFIGIEMERYTEWLEFQNIICYCLSTGEVIPLEKHILFQNIICYGLSLAFALFSSPIYFYYTLKTVTFQFFTKCQPPSPSPPPLHHLSQYLSYL